MKIKKFNDFVSESISGAELVGPVGPAYGETGLQNKTISQTMFQGCTSLTSVSIPSSITSIGVSAFNGCTRLTNISIENKIIRYLKIFKDFLNAIFIFDNILFLS